VRERVREVIFGGDGLEGTGDVCVGEEDIFHGRTIIFSPDAMESTISAPGSWSGVPEAESGKSGGGGGGGGGGVSACKEAEKKVTMSHIDRSHVTMLQATIKEACDKIQALKTQKNPKDDPELVAAHAELTAAKAELAMLGQSPSRRRIFFSHGRLESTIPGPGSWNGVGAEFADDVVDVSVRGDVVDVSVLAQDGSFLEGTSFCGRYTCLAGSAPSRTCSVPNISDSMSMEANSRSLFGEYLAGSKHEADAAQHNDSKSPSRGRHRLDKWVKRLQERSNHAPTPARAPGSPRCPWNSCGHRRTVMLKIGNMLCSLCIIVPLFRY